VSILVFATVAALGVLGWQVHAKSNDIDQLHQRAAGNAHAEQAALDYATGAAEMDFHDLVAWRGKLTKGTTPELSNRLTQAATSMEQIIAPLQWTSTAKPIVAKVRSESNGVYSVDCFVSVLTKNSQAPDGIQSTATYQLTIDSHNSWVITDIAGIDSALGSKGAPR
jgi:Mce-associated membrane protein